MLELVPALRSLPAPGQLVQARNRRFVVTAIDAGAALDGAMPQHLVSMSSVEDDGLGEELRALADDLVRRKQRGLERRWPIVKCVVGEGASLAIGIGRHRAQPNRLKLRLTR